MKKYKRILILIFIIFTNFTFYELMAQKSDSIYKNKIHFSEFKNEEDKNCAINIIDKSLKQNGDFGVYGSLKEGLEIILKISSMKVKNSDTIFYVSIYPDSNSGHDFSMKINKMNLKISDLVVGEIDPDPEEE